MTRDDMVASLNTRFGGGLERIVGQDTDEVYRVLSEAQQQVSDEMVAAIGIPAMPTIDEEIDSSGVLQGRTGLYQEVPAINATAEPILPAYYHQAIILAAARILAQRMGDNAPRAFKDPQKLVLEYREALERGHQLQSQAQNAGSPNRIRDGYFGDAGLYEEF